MKLIGSREVREGMSYSVTLTAPRLIRCADGTLQAKLDGHLYEQVKLVRAFPFSIPDNFISLRTADDKKSYC